MRCICCNRIMSQQELSSFKDDAKTVPEDFCRSCLNVVNVIDEPLEKDYAFQHITDRLFHFDFTRDVD